MAKTYDPKDISIIVGGVPISGFADGTFVEIERNEDMFALTVGADGEGARSKSNNRSGTLKFTLLQTSDSNQYMSALALIDEQSNAGAVPVMVRDNLGKSVFLAESAWIKKMATSTFSKSIESREWVMETDTLVMNVGGTS